MSDTPLTPTRFARVRELFDEALEREPAERAAYLARAAAGDPSLAAEVEGLLAAYERAEGSWPTSAEALVERTLADYDEGAAVGRRVGPYEVTRLLGVGGMGAVYEGARADAQFRKRVAIKFLRRGLEGDLAVRRFRYERQILASLSHPNVAALLDGGVTPDGAPYLVMEYVDGEPITAHCARRALGLRARVRLLRQVCAAVQHAHQHLVVHRDLKPGNILVDDAGAVKLLDFGIARLLREPEDVEALPATQGGLRAFTPDYASPEQVRGLPVAAASDVYSLGVVCAEVLSGHRPFALQGKLLGEVEAAVCLAPAPAPSTLVTDADAAAFGERGARGAARVRAQLAGDLDAIVLQALRKEPERRYGSAEQLGADLGRWLEGRPVAARRDRFGYRLGKFVRRRRAEVAAAALAVAALVAAVVVSARAARRAEVERAKTEQVNEFLATMLAAVDPGNDGRDVTVAQVLAQSARDVARAALDPEIEAQIRHTLGQTYYELGLYDSAETHARRAFELRRRVLGERNIRTIYSLSYLVGLAEARGAFAQAESLARVNVDWQRRMGHARSNPADLSTAMDGLARNLTRQGRFGEATAVQLEALALLRRRDDSASRATLPYALTNLAVTHNYVGETEKALAFAREAVAAERRVNGTGSVVYGTTLRALGAMLDEAGRREEADSVAREAIAVLRATVGTTHTEYLRAVNVLATVRYGVGDMAGAVAAAREVTAAIGGGLHESENAASGSLQTLGLALDSLGRHAEADSALRRSLALRREYLPPDHWGVASAEAALGHHLALVGRHAEGEAMMRRAYARLAEARGAGSGVARRAAARLADLLARTGRAREAAEWRARS